eukprot:CAMPEP_0177546358 /NCGR_PEP_ID=MMETSP0369-20130122/63178_1 /TAXON_ID=447022 ORGANISM="Scrippsiella hangoei-like, Strain SHHI-4" /NCGR_SAMPLE_ID=MMETSP0369 /ASSEMBLY_ACC=CAM_ASM_000364 /LENGTH=93 /DNA_ID=CAMNT_0019030851 /DNA_START=119 /DNA_END=397 /DNA_ORIENTATION=-
MIVNLTQSSRNMLFDFQRTENMRLLPRPQSAFNEEPGIAGSVGGVGGGGGPGVAGACAEELFCYAGVQDVKPLSEESSRQWYRNRSVNNRADV